VPFTASHAAAVLPFLRSPLPASALVIGSMAPDFPYYLPWSTGWPTHTPLGVVTVDLAIGAVGWSLWHGVLAAPSLEHAPAGEDRTGSAGCRGQRGPAACSPALLRPSSDGVTSTPSGVVVFGRPRR
jgi:hypothetical protein